MRYVWIVEKNADFTEGRGPMLFHKAFANEADAVAYIMDQAGIFGSKQNENFYSGDSNYRSFNGYGLKHVFIIEEYIPNSTKKRLVELKTKRKELEDALQAIEYEIQREPT